MTDADAPNAGEVDADVLVVGGGPAGLAAATFTARAGLDTLVVDRGDSILRRNAHLENYPGFPAGIDARLLLSLMGEGAERAGAERLRAEVVELAVADEAGAMGEADAAATATGSGGRPGIGVASGFVAETATGERFRTRFAICASKNEAGYLAGIDGVALIEEGKTFVETDRRGRTGAPGLYAAGRLAGKPHQAVVATGHGAEVAVTLLEDADLPFYHDWVAPERYFTGRGRDVPPGCEEIDDAERERRAEEAGRFMADRLADHDPEPPVQHPSVADEE